MTSLAEYQDFLTDKQNLTLGSATRQDYAFLAKNRPLIQQEFDHLYKTIKKMGGFHPDLWRRFYHYTGLLHQYYLAHGEPNKAADYQRKAAEITTPAPIKNDSLVLNNAYKFLGIENEPDALGKTYKFWGNANMLRLEAAFSRVTVKQALLFADNLQWADSPVDLSQMISVIDAPAPVFNALSLGLFACRFSINVSQIIKHTWFPTPEENDGTFSACERFCQEIYDRQYHLLNDVVWFSVNLFCNYNAFWNLSDLFAGELTAIFLVFDALWLVWSRHLIEETYLIKREQYLAEKTSITIKRRDFAQQGVVAGKQLSDLLLEDTLLDMQLAELELEWQTNNASYVFSIAAAAVFTTGYSATMLFAAPAAIVFSFFMCTIAVAMYLSADEFANYQQKSYLLEINDTPEAQNELDTARNAFIRAMLKNTFMPLFVVTSFALCWPAAVAGTVLYISHCLLAETNDASLPASAAANDEDSDTDSDDEIEGDNARLVCS